MMQGRILTGPERATEHGAEVPGSRIGAATGSRAAQSGFATLDAMSVLAHQTRSAVHVVLAREPGVVEHARNVARTTGVQVSVDLMAFSVRVRFDGTRG